METAHEQLVTGAEIAGTLGAVSLGAEQNGDATNAQSGTFAPTIETIGGIKENTLGPLGSGGEAGGFVQVIRPRPQHVEM